MVAFLDARPVAAVGAEGDDAPRAKYAGSLAEGPVTLATSTRAFVNRRSRARLRDALYEGRDLNPRRSFRHVRDFSRAP